MFRVGQADETLPNRGITHLIEHLDLFRLNLTDYHSGTACRLGVERPDAVDLVLGDHL